MPLVLLNTASADVASPAAGSSSLFVDENGLWKSKSSAGVSTAIAGSAASSLLKAPVDLTRIRRIMPFGDSITQNNSTWVNGAAQAGGGYAENAIRKAARFTFLGNAGIGGNTVAQMRARLATDIFAYNPEAILMMGGTNSIITGMTFAQMAAVLNDYEYIIQQCLANGVVPILVTPPAKNQAGLDQDNTGWSEMRDFIPFLYDMAAYYGLPLIDVFKFTADPTTGGFRTGLSDDGVHPNAIGHARIADYVQFYLRNPQLAMNQVYLASVSEFGTSGRLHNIIQNGCFDNLLGDGVSLAGWGDGAKGDNTTVLVPTAADTALARASGRQFKYTATGGNLVLVNGLDPAAYAVGDVVEFSARITAPVVADADLSNGDSGINFYMDLGDEGGLVKVLNNDKSSQDVIVSAEFKVPAGTTSMSLTSYIITAGAYSFANMTVTNKTTRQGYWKPGTPQN